MSLTPEQWLQKYHPVSLNEIAGHTRTIRLLREWLHQLNTYANANTATRTKSTPPPPITFLYGPGGIGKTTLARALLENANYHVYELNSGEVRSKKRIEEIMEKIFNNHSVSMMKKKGTQHTIGIVMDEIDGMSCGDRGGLHELFNIVQKQFENGVVANPVICISNKPYDKKLPSTLYQDVQVRQPSDIEIANRLRAICDSEGVVVDDITLMWITKYGEKDVRRTIHFLQELVFYFGNVPGRELTVEDVDAVKQITSNTVADYNLLDITRTIFSRKIPLDELHGMYKSDPYLIQIMMHDNLHVQLQQKNVLSTDSVETMDPYTDTLHHLNLSSLLASQKGHWELQSRQCSYL